MEIDERIDAIGKQPFRQKFHLYGREAATVQLRGREAIRRHAHDLIDKKLAPADPYKDGKQTPYRGHPVFVAQHATATCCRGCLAKWHAIPQGHELTPAEIAYILSVLRRWLMAQTPGDLGGPAAH